MLLIAHTAIQVLLKRQHIAVFRKEHLWPLLYAGWTFLVFALNPTGLAIFGSSVVGARYYFQIFLAITTFLIIANNILQERDAKLIFLLLFTATTLNTLHAFLSQQQWDTDVRYRMLMGEFLEPGDLEYTWHQSLSPPAMVLLMFLFSRFSMTEFLTPQRWYCVALILLCFAVILYSGKRAAAGTAMVLPLFAAVLRRQYVMGFLMAVFIGGLALLLALGHGKFFTLPPTAQRAISYLPGKWHPSANLGFEDSYRDILRKDALDQIKAHPWIGKGYALSVSEYWADFYASRGQIISGIRAGGSWHTTWLGIAADFGIPAAVIWACLWISFTRRSFSVANALPKNSMAATLAGYIFLGLCASWLNSWTSGHSALNAFDSWWQYAMLFPLQRLAASSER